MVFVYQELATSIQFRSFSCKIENAFSCANLQIFLVYYVVFMHPHIYVGHILIRKCNSVICILKQNYFEKQVKTRSCFVGVRRHICYTVSIERDILIFPIIIFVLKQCSKPAMLINRIGFNVKRAVF